MKFFIFAGLTLGAIVTIAGIGLMMGKLEYLVKGINTPAKVVGFEEREENIKVMRRGSRAVLPVYYPVIEYTFQGNRYEYVQETYQRDTLRPFAQDQQITILCTPSKSKEPFVGTLMQLVLKKMFVALAGIAILLVCGVMGLIAWLKGDLDDRPVSYVKSLA